MDYTWLLNHLRTIQEGIQYLIENGHIDDKYQDLQIPGLLIQCPKTRRTLIIICRCDIFLKRNNEDLQQTRTKLEQIEELLPLLFEVTSDHYNFLPKVVRDYYEKQLLINQDEAKCLEGTIEDYEFEIDANMILQREREEEILLKISSGVLD